MLNIPILVIALRITSTPPEPPRAPCSCGKASRRQSSQPGGQAAGAQAANKYVDIFRVILAEITEMALTHLKSTRNSLHSLKVHFSQPFFHQF